MLLNDNIVGIEKLNGICLLTFVVNDNIIMFFDIDEILIF